MRCPECALENRADAKRCARCGADLTQTVLMAGESHRNDQVWNSDIETDRNKQNTKAAMVVLGIGVLLTVVLIVLLAVWLPRGLSFSMDSISLPDISVAQLLEELLESEPEPAPEPEPPPAMALSGADLDFINVLAAYAIELSYMEDAEQQREIHQMFYPEFEYLFGRKFEYGLLEDSAAELMILTEDLGNSRTEYIDRLYFFNDLCRVVVTVEDFCSFLSDDPEVLDYYVNMREITYALLEVEHDLQNQLIGAGTVWSDELGCETVEYTNNTPYTLDITFYNDFVTDEEQYSDAYSVGGLLPRETESVPLYALSNIQADEDHIWYISWNVDDCYLDGVSVWEYDY